MKRRLMVVITLMLSIVMMTACNKAGTSSQVSHKMPELNYSDMVVIGDYKSLTCKLNESDYTVTQEGTKQFIYYVYYNNIVPQSVTDRGIEEGDTVTLKMTCSINGVITDSTNDKGTALTIGRHSRSDIFDKHLIGLKVGDKTSFDVTYPKDYENITYRGQTAKYDMEILKIETKYVPLNDNFATKYTEYKTYQELYDKAVETLKLEAVALKKEHAFSQYLSKLIETSTWLKEPDLTSYESDINAVYATAADTLGITDEQYRREYLGVKTEEDYNALVTKNANDYAKSRIIIAEIARLENIEIQQDEFDTYINNMLTSNGLNTESSLSSVANVEVEGYIDIAASYVRDYLIEINNGPKS